MQIDQKKVLENVLDKIKNKEVVQTSKYWFLGKEWTLRFLVFLSILFTSLAFAAILFIFSIVDIDNIKHVDDNSFRFIFKMFPYFWLTLSIFFTATSFYIFKNTKNSYKISGKKILAVAYLCIVILTTVLYTLGLGRKVDNIRDPFGFKKPFQEHLDRGFENIEMGRIIGEIVSIDKNYIVVKNVSTSTNLIVDISEVRINDGLNVGDRIKVVGYFDEGILNACLLMSGTTTPRGLFFGENKKNKGFDRKEDISEECQQILELGRSKFQPKKFGSHK